MSPTSGSIWYGAQALIEEHYEYLFARARQAARNIHKFYPMVAVEDLVQEAMTWCLVDVEQLAEFLAGDDPRAVEKAVLREMRNACKQYARTEKAAMYGYDLDDEVFYGLGPLVGDSRQNAGGLLHYIYDREDWLSPPRRADGQRRANRDAEGNNWVTTLADVAQAVTRNLNEYQQWLLEKRFGPERWTFERIGSDTTWHDPPISKRTAQHRVESAARAVQTALGGFQPHPVGSRKVISNAYARVLTSDENNHQATNWAPGRPMS